MLAATGWAKRTRWSLEAALRFSAGAWARVAYILSPLRILQDSFSCEPLDILAEYIFTGRRSRT